jgi:class 3 adenylate cyclase/tetratricopeptide (TPR) repeat protein
MRCPRCRHQNPQHSRFCAQCGANLGLSCAGCGTQLLAGTKFCNQCGRPVAGSGADERFESPQSYTPRHLAEKILKSGIEGERKQVTVLFADLKGSMELLADRDPEEARKLLDPVLERMMEAVHHYEGTVNQVMGDGIMALFGAPLAHEDHAVRACYAALRMQDAIRRYAEAVRRAHGVEIRVRVGINSGEVVVRSIGSDLRMDYTAVGQTTHLAARMEQLALPGTIRLTAATLALVEGYVEVRPLGPVPVKGMTEPVEVYDLAGAGAARTRLQAARGRGLTRFVGRDAEMQQLRLAADEARRGRGQVVAVVGEPGVGKSRLYYEFLHSHHAHGWLALESGSVSYGKATTFLPLADLLRGYFKIESRDDIRAIRAKATGNLLTLDEGLKDAVAPVLWLLDALPEDSDFLAGDPAERRRRTLAAVKRVLLRESQVQPLLLVFEDLHWVDSETQAFLDGFIESLPAARILLAVNYRPEYRHGWGSKTYYRQLRIDPLAAESASDLLEGLLGSDSSVAPLKSLLIERTEGNPLFLEESVRTLVETGALTGARGAYKLVHGLQAISVPPTVQSILASRIDRLSPDDKRLLQAAAVVGTDVPFSLLQAVADLDEDSLRQGLARLQAAEFMYEARLFPELEYAFKHALTHEVAYGSVLQERRQVLHARIVEAIERLYADRIAEQVELLAHHASRGRILAKAAKYLRLAGTKAAARSANREAVGFFEQALTILDDSPQSPETLSDALDIRIALGAALMATKGASSPDVENFYLHALALADQVQDPARRFPVIWGLWFVKFNRGHYAEAVADAEKLLDTARATGDAGQVLEAHHSLWPTLSAMGDSSAALGHLEHGLALYDREQHAAQAFIYGGHDAGACCHWHLAVTHWALGFPERAQCSAANAIVHADELQHPMTRVMALWFAAWVEFQCGYRDSAAQRIDKYDALAGAHGLQGWFGRGAMLTGDTRNVETIEREIQSLKGSSWRKVSYLCILAEIYASRGHLELARRLLASIGTCDREGYYAPEIVRLEGELILKADSSALRDAELCFQSALQIARHRGTRSFELRAATRLAALWVRQKRNEQAHRLLAPIYGQFSEGFETADLRAAQALLKELA